MLPSGVGVEGDGGYVRFHAPHLDSGLRRKDGGEGPGMMGVTCGSTPHAWVPVCAGKTVWRVAEGGG